MSSYWFGDVEDYKRFSGDTLREYKRYFSDYDYTQWDNDDFLEQKQLFGMTKWSNSLCQKFQKLCQEMEQAIVGGGNTYNLLISKIILKFTSLWSTNL